MDLDEKKSGLFRRLVQFEADPNKKQNLANLNMFYLKLLDKRGLLCLNGGVHSTECHFRKVNENNLVLYYQLHLPAIISLLANSCLHKCPNM